MLSHNFKRPKMSKPASNLFELIEKTNQNEYFIDLNDEKVKEFIECVFEEIVTLHMDKNNEKQIEYINISSENLENFIVSETVKDSLMCPGTEKKSEDAETLKYLKVKKTQEAVRESKTKQDTVTIKSTRTPSGLEEQKTVKCFLRSIKSPVNKKEAEFSESHKGIKKDDLETKNIKLEDPQEVTCFSKDQPTHNMSLSENGSFDSIGIDEEVFLSLFYHSYEMNDEDKRKSAETNGNEQSRYFLDTRICYKCGKIGHIDSKCPDRIKQLCILCGCIDHQRYNCLQIICTKCNKHGHRFRECRENVDHRQKYHLCDRCPNRHTIRDCPLSWRKYKYFGLENLSINMSCSFCLKEDHFIDDCTIRKSKNSIFTEKYENMLGGSTRNLRRPYYR